MEDTDMDVWTLAFERRMLIAMKKQLAYHAKSMEKCCESSPVVDTDVMDVSEAGEEQPEIKKEKMSVDVDAPTEPVFCAWCAQTEEYASSQFVHGHTWPEWYEWKQSRDERARSRQEAVDRAAALELDRILSGEGPSLETSEDDKLKDTPTTMVQVWLPVNKEDADLVLREAAYSTSGEPGCSGSLAVPTNDSTLENSVGVESDVKDNIDDKLVLYPPPSVEIEVLKGSVIVHECCAEAMSAVRMSKYTSKLEAYQKAYRTQRRLMNSKAVKRNSAVQVRLEAALRLALNRKEGQYPEERTLADVLVGLGQGKVVSLGYDFSGHVYYAMSGSKALLVCSKRNPDYSPGENPVCEDSAPFSMVSMPDPLGTGCKLQTEMECHDSIVGQARPVLQWKVFHRRTEIETITAQLSQDEAPERSLRSALEILYLRKFGSSQQNDGDDEEEDDDAPIITMSRSSLSDMLSEHQDYQTLLAGDFSSLQLDGRPTPSQMSTITDVSRDSMDIDEGTQGSELGKRKAPVCSEDENQISKLRSLASTWQAETPTPVAKVKYEVGSRVLCEGHDCLGNALLWDAKVLAVRLKSKQTVRSGMAAVQPELNFYKVRYIGWGSEYDAWLPEDELNAVSGMGRNKQSALRAKAGNYSYVLANELEIKDSTPTKPWVPEILTTLAAYTYIAAPGRHNHKESRRSSGLPVVFNPSRNTLVPRLSSSRRSPADDDSDDNEDDNGFTIEDQSAPTIEVVRLSVTDELSILKAAMLMVQAAFPLGSMDESEDRWGRGAVSPVPYFESMALSDANTGGGAANQGPAFLNAWRHAVTNASTPAQLMECQLVLEFGVRTAWLKSTGAKLMTCLPSRSQAIRGSTLGLVATRLWCLDKAVRYDKVKKGEGILEDEVELRKEKKNKLKAKQASRIKKQQKEESNKKRAQYRR
jgi:hypothetical protein